MDLKLPDNYTYKLIECNDAKEMYRIKEISDKLSAEIWIDKLCTKSRVTWRVLKTYPKAGIKNIYRKDFRCQHYTDRRSASQGPSKNTDCPATLQVIVKRFVKYSRSKKVDLLQDYPTVVVFKKKHNHPIDSAASLKHRDMSNATKEKLRSLFHRGHNPSSAYHSLKMDLVVEHGENYYKIAADGHYLPSVSIVTKLFRKEFSAGNIQGEGMLKKYDECSGGKAMFERTFNGEHYFANLCSPMLGAHENVAFSSDGNQSEEDVGTLPEDSISDPVIHQFEDFISRIKNGLQSDPNTYVPALEKMMKNVNSFAKTENGLISAMHTFGLHTGIQSPSQRRILQQSPKTCVQPTAVSRRKSLLSGRRKILKLN